VNTTISSEVDATIRTKQPSTAAKKTKLGAAARRRPCSPHLGRLERLFEEEPIEIEGESATSAFSKNTTVLAYGFAIGDQDGARTAIACWSCVISTGAAVKIDASMQFNASRDFLAVLHAITQRYADVWIEECLDRFGAESTVDIETQYL
jgi:hypothetical protein